MGVEKRGIRVLINNHNRNAIFLKFLSKEGFKNILRQLFYVFLLFCFSILLMYWFRDYSESIAHIFTWILTIYILVVYFKFIPRFLNKREIISLEKRLHKVSNRSLYEWIAIDYIHDITIYNWLQDIEEKDIIKNLNTIKNRISTNVGDNINNYYLLKKYLEYHGKNNFMHSIWKSIGPILTASIGSIILKVGLFDWLYNYILEDNLDYNFFEDIEFILGIMFLILSTLLIFYFIKSEFTKEKRRIDLLISIIEVIIEEKRTKR